MCTEPPRRSSTQCFSVTLQPSIRENRDISASSSPFPSTKHLPASYERAHPIGTIVPRVRHFIEQKGWLQEELETPHQELLFYPKFHCEPNFIERFWCAAKFYTRENFQYSLDGLREVLPAALQSVSSASINRYYDHCAQTIDVYASGLDYGTKAFKEQIYKGHRQVSDKSKW